MGLLMNAVNSAVSRKARAATEGAKDGPSDHISTPEAHQPENNDDKTTADVESTTSPVQSIAISEDDVENKVEGEGHDGQTVEVAEEAKHYAQEDMASNKSQSISIQRSTSISESNTSSKRAEKERKGFLRFNLLRKKVEAERSASSTPDSERHVQGSNESSPRKWKSWGRKGRSKDVDEMVKVDESEVSVEEHVQIIRERLKHQFSRARED